MGYLNAKYGNSDWESKLSLQPTKIQKPCHLGPYCCEIDLEIYAQ